MVRISGINRTGAEIAKNKNINKTILPVVSGLTLLAGSSMNGANVPPNAEPHEPGTSVDDSMWEQIKHAGKLVKNLGDEIGDGAIDLAKTILKSLDDMF